MVLKMTVLPTTTLHLLNQWKLVRGQVRNSDRALLGLQLQHEGAEQGTGSVACSWQGQDRVSWSLKQGQSRRVRSRAQAKEG